MQDVDAPQSKIEKRLVTSGLRGGGGTASTAVCVGCGGHILDQYILRVAPDLEWHAACLKCAECHVFLDETCTCFVRAGKTYCKHDYVRLFGAKCAKCLRGFDKSDFVMRAKNKIFHMDCFRCVACTRHLVPGDEFALRDDGLFCRADSDIVDKSGAVNNNLDEIEIDTKANILNNNNNEKAGSGAGSPNSTDSRTTSSGGGGGGGGGRKKDGHKTTRVRTVLNEKQLHTLRTCYNANPRPDALMKEQLVEMTNLSPRVIRVWFQNKRCKDKKRSIALKQMQQQQQEKQGVPMIASSPVRHEPPPGLGPGGPVDVQSYQAPWKALSEFANMGGGGGDMEQPPFQQLVSSFGPGPESASDDDDSIMTLEDQQQHGGGGPPVSMAGLLGPPPPPHGLHLHHGGHHPGGPPPPHMLMHDLDAKC